MSLLGDQMRDWHRGVQAVARGDWGCALHLFSDVPEPPARICFNVGCVHLLAGDPEAALRAFDQAVTKDPCMAVGFLQRGVANFQLGRFLEAVSDFQQALVQLRGNAAIDYNQLGLHFRLQAWEVLYNMASAQCQTGLWTEAANTLLEAISKWPEGAQDNLYVALDHVRKQVPLQLRQVPRGEVFRPHRRHLKHLEPMDFLGKAKVVASTIPDDQHSVWPQQRSRVKQDGHQAPPSTGLLASEGPGAGPSKDPSGTEGEAAEGPESSVTATVQCHFTIALKVPRGAGLSSLQALLAKALLHQGQLGQLSYQVRGEEGLWIPISGDESLQSMWKDMAVGHRRGLRLQCRVSRAGRPQCLLVAAQAGRWREGGGLFSVLPLKLIFLPQGAVGRPILYQVVAQHDYSAQEPEDLAFHRGDKVDVLCEVDEAWLEGHHDGHVGIFPKCFVVPVGACEGAPASLGLQPGDQH